MSISLIEFQEGLQKGGNSGTKEAMSQARYKIKWIFFEALLYFIVGHYLCDNKSVKRFKGFRLEGVDGTNLHLTNIGDIKEVFHVHRNQHGDCDPQAQVLVRFDLLNKIGISGQIASTHISEQVLVLQDIRSFPTSSDSIRVYDRGFYSYELLYEHLSRNQHFVIRVSVSKTCEIIAFVASGARSGIINIVPTAAAAQALGVKRDTLPALAVRAIRVELPDGNFSILLTSFLDDSVLDCADIEEVYRLRWGVETYFDLLKNKYQIENFVGHSAEAIRQEFFATLCISTLNQILLEDTHALFDEKMAEAKKKKPDMLPQAMNVNVSIGLLLPKIGALLYHVKPVDDVLKYLKSQFIRHYEPVRPNRSYKRNKKARHMHGKYKTYSNYRRAA
jgi:hypothetical protein